MRSDRILIFRSTAALTVVQFANLVLPLATVPYLLHTLGAAEFGVLGFCQALLAYGVVITEYGFNFSATKRIAEVQSDKESVSRIFWSVQTTKAMLSLLALAIIVMGVTFVPKLRHVWPVAVASMPVIFGAVLFPQWLFQGLERMAFVAFCVLLSKAVAIPLIFMFVTDRGDTCLAAVIQSTTNILAGLVSIAVMWRYRLVKFVRPTAAGIGDALKSGWHLFVSTAAISVYTAMSPLVLGLSADHAAVGLFSAADKIRLACQSLISPFSAAVYPRVSALMATRRDSALSLVRKILVIQGGATFLLSIALWWLAPEIVRLFMGPGYHGSIIIIRWLAPTVFLVGLSNVLGIQMMLPLGMNSTVSRVVVGSSLLNLVLLIVFVPRLSSVGAAMALVTTETVVTTSMAILLIRARAFKT